MDGQENFRQMDAILVRDESGRFDTCLAKVTLTIAH